MKITFLGTGGVFDYEFGNSAAIVTRDAKRFLIDCGPSVYAKLRDNDLIDSVAYVLITHLHGDHVGSLFQLIAHLNVRSTPHRKAIILYPDEAFRDHLYGFLRYWYVDPGEMVDLRPIAEVQGVHALNTTGSHMVGIPSYAYYFTTESELLYYSGDTGDVDVAARFLGSRDEVSITVYHEIHHLQGSAHVYYRDVMEKLSGYDVFGYHCDPRKLPSDNSIALVANHPHLLLR